MNKHFTFLLFLLFLSNLLSAQPPGVSGFRLYERNYKISIGPTAGFGLSKGTSSQIYDYNPKLGLSYRIGLAVNGHFGRRHRFGFGGGGTGWVGFEAEALYGSRIMKEGRTQVRVNCVEVPLLGQVYPISKLGFELGLTMVKVLSYTPELTPANNTFLYTGQIKAWDVMLSIGACYKLPIGLMFSARYNIGTSDFAGNFDTKESTAVVSLTYLIHVLQ